MSRWHGDYELLGGVRVVIIDGPVGIPGVLTKRRDFHGDELVSLEVDDELKIEGVQLKHDVTVVRKASEKPVDRDGVILRFKVNAREANTGGWGVWGIHSATHCTPHVAM